VENWRRKIGSVYPKNVSYVTTREDDENVCFKAFFIFFRIVINIKGKLKQKKKMKGSRKF
jgi:hypothetical protein